MEVMHHTTGFLLPSLPSDCSSLNYSLVILNQCLPRFAPLLWTHSRLRVCADGGANRLFDEMPLFFPDDDPLDVRQRYKPDLIKGDMDSIRPDVLDFYSRLGCNTVDESQDQDTTDLHKCIAHISHLTPDTAKSNLCILVTGALGGRFDHEAGNVNVLCHFSSLRIILLSDDCLIQNLPKTHQHEIHIQSSVVGPHCGLVPIGMPSACTTTSGLKWNLENTEMMFGGVVSTSNEVTGDAVTVKSDTDLLWTISIPGSLPRQRNVEPLFISNLTKYYQLNQLNLLNQLTSPTIYNKNHQEVNIIKMEVMHHTSGFLLPSLPSDCSFLNYALVILNQHLPRFAPLLWFHSRLRVCAGGGANRLFDEMPLFFPQDDPLEVRRRHKPDVIKGDMDSIRPDVLNFYAKLGCNMVDESQDQDTTDLHKSIAHISHLTPDTEKSNLCILVTGAHGGHFGHKAGNLNVLYRFSNLRIILLSDDCLIQILPKTHQNEIHIQSSVVGPHCGLIPVGMPSACNTTSGLEWNLNNTEMRFGGVVSTSNRVTGDAVTVNSDTDLLWTISIKS